MPGKLIAFIIALLIIVTFIGFNIENSSDIRIWFGENGLLEDVPIFVSFFVMYLVGVLSVIPFLMGWIRKKGRRNDAEDAAVEPGRKPEKKVRVLGGKKRSKEADITAESVTDAPADDEPAGEIPPEEN